MISNIETRNTGNNATQVDSGLLRNGIFQNGGDRRVEKGSVGDSDFYTVDNIVGRILNEGVIPIFDDKIQNIREDSKYKNRKEDKRLKRMAWKSALYGEVSDICENDLAKMEIQQKMIENDLGIGKNQVEKYLYKNYADFRKDLAKKQKREGLGESDMVSTYLNVKRYEEEKIQEREDFRQNMVIRDSKLREDITSYKRKSNSPPLRLNLKNDDDFSDEVLLENNISGDSIDNSSSIQNCGDNDKGNITSRTNLSYKLDSVAENDSYSRNFENFSEQEDYQQGKVVKVEKIQDFDLNYPDKGKEYPSNNDTKKEIEDVNQTRETLFPFNTLKTSNIKQSSIQNNKQSLTKKSSFLVNNNFDYLQANRNKSPSINFLNYLDDRENTKDIYNIRHSKKKNNSIESAKNDPLKPSRFKRKCEEVFSDKKPETNGNSHSRYKYTPSRVDTAFDKLDYGKIFKMDRFEDPDVKMIDLKAKLEHLFQARARYFY